MSKVERLYHLHNILSQRRTPISRQDLMERLECSQATLYRLVGELRDFSGRAYRAGSRFAGILLRSQL